MSDLMNTEVNGNVDTTDTVVKAVENIDTKVVETGLEVVETSDKPKTKQQYGGLSLDTTVQSGKLNRVVSDEHVIYKLNVAGTKKENLAVTFKNSKLIISAVDRDNDTVSYRRSILVANNYNVDSLTSSYTDGVLELTIPIMNAVPTKTFTIE